MRVADILDHFLSRATWIDREKTVDRIITGDPNASIDRCVVTWMSSFKALRHVVDKGVRLLVCHEPTFWHHRDERPDDDVAVQEKLGFINEHGLSIVRNHDCWDRWPDIGIPWAWARFLGLKGRPAAVGAGGYQHRYDIEPVPLEDFARRVAERCGRIGEPLVQVTGDASQTVEFSVLRTSRIL